MNTKQSTTQKTKPTTILICPEYTIVGGKFMHPDNMAIVLENGHSYDIDIVVDLLEAHDKKKYKGKPKLFRRIRHVKDALNKAINESLDDQPMATRNE